MRFQHALSCTCSCLSIDCSCHRQGDFVLEKERSCTDFLFLIIYILFWLLMIAVGIIGFVTGDPARLSYGYDFNGNVCGQGTQTDKSYL